MSQPYSCLSVGVSPYIDRHDDRDGFAYSSFLFGLIGILQDFLLSCRYLLLRPPCPMHTCVSSRFYVDLIESIYGAENANGYRAGPKQVDGNAARINRSFGYESHATSRESIFPFVPNCVQGQRIAFVSSRK